MCRNSRQMLRTGEISANTFKMLQRLLFKHEARPMMLLKFLDKLQRSCPPGRDRLANEDRKSIADMKAQVDIAFKSFPVAATYVHRSLYVITHLIYDISFVSGCDETRLGRFRASATNKLVSSTTGNNFVHKLNFLYGKPKGSQYHAISGEQVTIDSPMPAPPYQLTGEDVSKQAALLADSHYQTAIGLAGSCRYEKALTASRQVVDMRRALAVDHPAMFNVPLANSLHNMSHCLTAMTL